MGDDISKDYFLQCQDTKKYYHYFRKNKQFDILNSPSNISNSEIVTFIPHDN